MNKILTKTKSVLQEDSKVILLIIAMTLFSACMLICKIHELQQSIFDKWSILTFVILAVLTILMTGVLYMAKRKQWKIERIFLICGLLLGTIYCIFLPIGGASDEPAHFWRVYELSEGRLMSPDGEFIEGPDNIKDVIKIYNEDGYKLELENFTSVASTNYAPVQGSADNYVTFNYIPQIIGVWLGKLINLPLIPMMYLARIFNMVVCILGLYFCVKYIPIFKKVIFLVTFFPMTMQQISSVSPDGSIICAGMGIITFVLYARHKLKNRFNVKHYLLLIALSLILIMNKPVYVFLLPIWFWIPKNKFKSLGAKVGILSSLLAIICILLFTKMILFSNLDNSGMPGIQFEFIFRQPLTFLELVFKNIVISPILYIGRAIGYTLEWSEVGLYAPYIITMFLMFAFLCAERAGTISRSLRIFCFVSFVTILVATTASMFIYVNTPGTTEIWGVHGRYFTPILLLIPLFCLPAKKQPKRKLVNLEYLYTSTALINVFALAVIFCSHI